MDDHTMNSDTETSSLEDNGLKSAQDWHETVADPGWRSALASVSDVNVPSTFPIEEYNTLNEDELEIYRTMLGQTRIRQNGPYQPPY